MNDSPRARPRRTLRRALLSPRLATTLALALPTAVAACLDAGEALPGRIDGRPAPMDELCLELRPQLVDFGSTLVGQRDTASVLLVACGDDAVVIDSIRLAPGSDPAFDLPTLTGPVVLQPGARWSLPVSYAPLAPSGHDPTGAPLRDLATVWLEPHASAPLELPLRGYAW